MHRQVGAGAGVRGDLRVLPQHAGQHLGAEEEHGRRGAVVRATGAVALDAPAELAEGHPEHAVLQPQQMQVVLEGVDAVGEPLQQIGMHAERVIILHHLLRVGVEAVDAHPVDARLQATADQLRHDLQGAGQLGAGLVPRGIQRAQVAVGQRGGLDHVAVEVRLLLHGAHEVELAAFAVRGHRIGEVVVGEVERILGVVDGGAHGHAHVLQSDGDGPADADGERIGHGGVGVALWEVGVLQVEVATGPAAVQQLIAIGAGLPDVRAAEVREVGIGIAHTLHDGELAVVPQLLHAAHHGVQAGGGQALQGQHRTFGDQHVAARHAQCIVLVERDHGVEAVVATVQLHDHEHAVLGGAIEHRAQQRVAEPAHGEAAQAGGGNGADEVSALHGAWVQKGWCSAACCISPISQCRMLGTSCAAMSVVFGSAT